MILKGQTIDLRLVEKSDAEFILSLRLNTELNKYLSEVSSSLDSQLGWIQNYKEREANKLEYYFIIEDKHTKERWGTIRLYDFRENSFCWGSWIIRPGRPSGTADQSITLLFDFAFFDLGFSKTHFDCRKNNNKALDYYLRMGATVIAEDELNYYFEYTKEEYEKIKEIQKRF